MSPFYWTKIKKKETCNANLHTLFYTLKLVNSIKLPTHQLLRKIRARHGKESLCCIRKKIPFLIKQLIIINIKIINMIEGIFVLGRKGETKNNK